MTWAKINLKPKNTNQTQTYPTMKPNNPKAAGIDPQLAAALADTQNIKPGTKITAVQADGDDGGDEAEADKQEGSLRETMREAMGARQTSLIPGKIKEDKPEEPKEKKLQSTESDPFPEINTDNVPASQQIKKKFTEFKERDKALKVELKKAQDAAKASEDARAALEAKATALEAGGRDLESSPAYKKLMADKEAADQLVERLDLAQSEKFQERFEAPKTKRIKKVGQFLHQIEDTEQKGAVVAALDAALAIAAGDENDPAFFKALHRAAKVDGYPIEAHAVIHQEMTAIRELQNEKAAALTTWTETKKKLDGEASMDRVKNSTNLLQEFDKANMELEASNPDRIKYLRAPENAELHGYDATIKPLIEDVKVEIDKSAKAGTITPKLLRYAREGVEAQFYIKQLALLRGMVQDLWDKNQVMEAKIGGKQKNTGAAGSAPAKSSVSSPAKSAQQTDISGFRKGSGILATMDEMNNGE